MKKMVSLLTCLVAYKKPGENMSASDEVVKNSCPRVPVSARESTQSYPEGKTPVVNPQHHKCNDVNCKLCT